MKKIVENVILTILVILVFQVASVFAGAVMTVNATTFSNICDDKLSLGEAAWIGRGGFPRALTNGERNQITGITVVPNPNPLCQLQEWIIVNGAGAGFADDILFSNDVGSLQGSIDLDKADDIDGLKPNGQKVILDGANILSVGIFLGTPNSGSQIRNMVIRNFTTTGISGQLLNGAIFQGLEIYDNGGNGIFISGNTTENILIGGDQSQHRNLIYRNGINGVRVFVDDSQTVPFNSQNIVIKNNYIGTSDGTSDNGNTQNGILLENTHGVTIGDTTGATRNIISGNNNDGIQIRGTSAKGNVVIGNFIGVDSTGAVALGNNASGVALLAGAGDFASPALSQKNRIGLPSLGNVISGNNFGVFFADGNTSNNIVQANYIGTNTGGNTDVGNSSDGIYFVNGTFDNVIGGTGANEGNLIAFNRNGIRNDTDVRNAFRRNRIFSNDLLGIDLAPVGVTPNDPGDGDTGANNLQNYPVITYINAQNSTTTVQGTFNSTANQTYTLEFFGNTTADSTGFGEGRNFIGSINVMTDGSGNVSFNASFSVSIATVGTWITATATDTNGNTSEFSQARNICADLTLSPSAIFITNAGGASSFGVSTSAGCGYSAQSNAAWVTLGSTTMGTVNFTVAANAGIQRSSSIGVFYNNGTTATFKNFNITQSSGCSFSLNPTSINMPATAGSATFIINASDASCGWTATSNAPTWIGITAGGSGTGSGSVSFSTMANTGSARSGTITAAGLTFTVNQASVGCVYTLNPTNVNVAVTGGTGSFNLTTTAGCAWSAMSNASWITVTGGSSGTGNGTINYTVAPNTAGSARTGTVSVAGQTFTINQSASTAKTLFDFDGDAKTDLSVFRPSGGEWWYLRSSDGQNRAFRFGTSTDKLTPADFTGDGKADIAFFRPSTGEWYVLRSENLTFYAFPFGTTNDIPVPADYDGDGKADAAVFRPSTATWYIQKSGGGNDTIGFGAATDKPVPADFDGDSRADIAIFRPSGTNGAEWWIRRSSNQTVFALQFGVSTDKAVPGDYTGDGKADVAFWRPSNGSWFVLRSENFTYYSVPFGINGDVPVSGDYDGDGKFDTAVFRPSNNTWYVQRSTAGILIQSFGQNNDVPIPGVFVP